MARPLHCLTAMPGCVMPPGWALPTQYPVQLTNTVYTHGVYWVARQEAGGQRGAGKERGRIEGGRDGGSKGREGGSEEAMMWDSEGAGVEVGREGWGRANNSLLHTVRTLHRYHAWNGTSEEGTKRGMDGARERKERLSERRKGGSNRANRGAREEWGKRAREAGILLRRTGYYKWKIVNWYIYSVLWCIVMYCLTGRWHDFMWWQLWTGCIWHVLGA